MKRLYDQRVKVCMHFLLLLFLKITLETFQYFKIQSFHFDSPFFYLDR